MDADWSMKCSSSAKIYVYSNTCDTITNVYVTAQHHFEFDYKITTFAGLDLPV